MKDSSGGPRPPLPGDADPEPDPAPSYDSLARRVFDRFVDLVGSGATADFEDLVRTHPAEEEELRRLHAAWSTGGTARTQPPPLPGMPSFFSRGGDRDLPRSGADSGQVVGDFRLIHKLGQGGMGDVWEAEQLSIHRRVALKLLRSANGGLTERERVRFHREAEAGGRINHPGIITVFALGIDHDPPYIAEELVEGGWTLADFIADMRGVARVPPDYWRRTAKLLIKILDALQSAHDAGVIHRDLKPQNILVTPDDEPKIADFGLARIVDAEPLSRSGELAGTYCYMSPEQALGQRSRVDHRTDVFSMGATMYELLTFHRAFEAKSTHEVAEKIISGEPTDARKVRPGVPRELALICGKALEKQRAHRYQSMSEFAADLRRYLQDVPILARPAGPLRRATKWVRRHRMGTAIAAVVVAALGIIGVLLSQQADTRREVEAAQHDRHLTEALLATERGDLEAARAEIDRAIALAPDDPSGHLVMAACYAQYARTREARVEIERARSKGFTGEEASLKDGIDHLCHGLYLFVQRDESSYPEADRHLARALELDPRLRGVHYIQYMLRSAVDDVAGAREALAAFGRQLGTGEDHYPVVAAQLLALQGEFAAACELLQPLAERPGMDEGRLNELGYFLDLGRNHLHLGNLDEAEEHLRTALAHNPSSAPACENLAIVLARRAEEAPGRAPAYLREAVEHARRAIAVDPGAREAHSVVALAAVYELSPFRTPGDPREAAARREAEAALAALARADPDSPNLGRLRAELAYLDADWLAREGDVEAALARFDAALAYDPDHVGARVLRAQRLWLARDFATALDELEHARATLEDLQPGDLRSVGLAVNAKPHWDRKWIQAIHVWTFGGAMELGDVERAREARDAAVAELDSEFTMLKEELLTLAEFLATGAIEELRDCDLALAIVEDHGLRGAFRGAPETRPIFAAIDAACR